MTATFSQAQWPAVFAHKLLPRLLFDDPSDKLLEILGNSELARPLIRYLVDNVALLCGFPEGAWKNLAADINLHRRNFGTVEGTVIEMPPPQIPPECYFIAIVPMIGDRPRYFTLECAFFPGPMLCEWTADRAHHNFGPGPDPDIDSFITAVIAEL
jgi:hypothetical protein